METNRCTGHCCRHFNLPYSLEKIKELDKTMVLESEVDLKIMQDMLIYLGDDYSSNFVEWSKGEWTKEMALLCSPAGGCYYYTCKHFDTESGDCKIYDKRPKMCRDYPYGNKCQYDGCTFVDGGE